MSKKKELPEISRRKFLADAGLLIGGAAIGSSVLLSACGGETETVTTTKTEQVTSWGCPYNCSQVFSTKAELKDHIYLTHAFNNVDGHVRTPVPFCIEFGSIRDRVESPGVSFMSADDNIQRHIDELIKRDWPTEPTLEMPTDLSVMSDAKLKYLGDIGCEMALDVGKLSTFDQDGVSYADQLAYVRDQKDEMEQKTGTQVRSARRSGSRHDVYTFAICEELGMKWYHLSPVYHYNPFQATAPFWAQDGSKLVMCPRPSLHLYVDTGDTVPVAEAIDAGNYF